MNWLFPARVISKLSLAPPKAQEGRQGLAICLIVRNEARHIAEWATFHKAAGVSHFHVYDNGCTDGTIDVLRETLDISELTLIPWDQKLADGRSGAEIHNQVLAYAHCLRNFGGRYRWMAFIDVDEFIVPVEAADIPAVLGKLEAHRHVSLPWHMFGRGGHHEMPEGGVLANYLLRARAPQSAKHALNWKCIVDPCHVTGVRVHGFDIDGQGQGVNDLGVAAAHGDRDKPGFFSNARLQLNHYYTRSGAELEAKIGRGSNKTVAAERHRKRVMRIVAEIEADTVEDRCALDFLNRRRNQ